MPIRPAVPGIERSFASAPSLDTERQAIHQRSRNWTPSSMALFGHDILVNVLTGDLTVSCRDIGNRFHDFMFGITRYYDAQEQHMRQCYLRGFVNVNHKPHWFGNWRFAYEADIEEVWHEAESELHVLSGAGINALFRENGNAFRRNISDVAEIRRALNTYGIPDRTLASGALDWSFTQNDFLLRTIRGPFQIAAGYFKPETLVDRVDAKLWVFNPSAGSGILLSSEFGFEVNGSKYWDLGPGVVAKRLVDALGHVIELKPVGAAPFADFVLSDGTQRDIQLHLDTEHISLDDHGRTARRRLVSKITDTSKAAHGDTVYNYSGSAFLSDVQLPSSIGSRTVKYGYHDSLPGALAWIENSSGERIQFEYEEDEFDCDERLNPRLKIRRITDPEGITFDYNYDNFASCTTVTVRNNSVAEREIQYRYIQDRTGTKQRYFVAAEVLVKTGYRRNNSGNIVRIQPESPQHVVSQTEYSGDGRYNVIRTIDPLNRAVEYTYNDFNQVLTVHDFDGHLTRYQYDIPLSPDAANPIGYDITTVMHENVVRSIDPANAAGFTQQLVTPTELFEYVRYDANNTTIASDVDVFSTHRLSKKTDILGNTWKYAYDDVNNSSCLLPSATTTPLGPITASAYNSRGERTAVTDALGNVHVSTFNSQGLLCSYVDPNGGKLTFNYYPCGDWLRDILDQNGKVTTFHRNSDGMVVRIVDSANDSVDFMYYRDQRLKRITKHRPAVVHDPADPTLKTADFANVTSEMKYSGLGEIVSAVNGNGLELCFAFDEAGRMCDWYYNNPAFPQKSKFVYDAAGQLTEVVNRSGSIASYNYYNSGNLKSTALASWNDGAASVPGKVINYTYDYFGRILTVMDSEFRGAREYCYDKAGSMIMRRDPGAHEFQFNYDANGRLVEVFNENGIFRFKAIFDYLNRVAAMSDSSALDGSLNWKYYYEKGTAPNKKVLSLFRREQVELGLMCDFDYDVRNRLVRTTVSGTQLLYDQTIFYRDDDLISEVKGADPNRYLYDGLKQLIYESLEPAHQDYDTGSNRLYKADRSVNPNPATSVFNAVNQLTMDGASASTLLYDRNGNLGSITDHTGSVTTFHFDNNNQLRKVRSTQFETSYKYYFDGALAEAAYKNVATGKADIFKFHCLFRRPILIEKNGATFMVLTWDSDGRLLRIRNNYSIGGATYQNSVFPVYDFAGNIVSLLDDNETALAQFAYNGWGERIRSVDPNGLGQFIGYKGGIADPMTGLVLFGNRWYSPDTGRWLSEDPLVSNTAAPTQAILNLYAYVSNNPVNWRDPKGLEKILGIHSNMGPSAGLTDGHAWISVYDIDFKSLTSYGLWPDSHPAVNDPGPWSDVRVDMERRPGYTAPYNRFYRLTKSQYERLESFILRNEEEWGLLHTCADWAADAVMYAVGEDVDADDYFGVETPREISRAILDLEAKQPTTQAAPLSIPDTQSSSSTP